MIKNLSFKRKTNYLFYFLLLLTLPFKIFNGEKEKVFSIFLIFITLLFLYLLFSKSNIKIDNSLYFLIILFVFLSMYLGKVINFYRFFPNWDKFLHLSSGPILAILGYTVFINIVDKDCFNKLNPIIPVLFALFFSIACAGLWEVFEFTSDNLFGLNAQNSSLIDTMWDIICGSLGGFLMSCLIYLSLIGKNIPFLKNIKHK